MIKEHKSYYITFQCGLCGLRHTRSFDRMALMKLYFTDSLECNHQSHLIYYCYLIAANSETVRTLDHKHPASRKANKRFNKIIKLRAERLKEL